MKIATGHLLLILFALSAPKHASAEIFNSIDSEASVESIVSFLSSMGATSRGDGFGQTLGLTKLRCSYVPEKTLAECEAADLVTKAPLRGVDFSKFTSFVSALPPRFQQRRVDIALAVCDTTATLAGPVTTCTVR